jgi:hypothetical protein
VAARPEVVHAAHEPAYRRQRKELRQPDMRPRPGCQRAGEDRTRKRARGPASAVTNVDRASAPRPSERTKPATSARPVIAPRRKRNPPTRTVRTGLPSRARPPGPWPVAAGPVAGHGLRLRKLRLRGVSRATRPGTVLARPGSAARVAVRGRDSFASTAPAPGPCVSISAAATPPPCSASALASQRVCARVSSTTERRPTVRVRLGAGLLLPRSLRQRPSPPQDAGLSRRLASEREPSPGRHARSSS